MPGQYRQGDLLLCAVDLIPSAAARVRSEADRVVVAEGELSGHAHAFAAKRVRLFREKKTQRAFLRIGKAGAQLRHEEHDPIAIPEGVTSCGGSGNTRAARRAWSGIDRDALPPADPRRARAHPGIPRALDPDWLSTTPIEHDAAEMAIRPLYAAAGLGPPHVVWAPCPMTAMLSAIVYTGVRATGREAEARDSGGLAEIVGRITRFALIATVPAPAHRRMRRHVEAAVAAALHCAAPNGSGFDAGFAIEDWRRAALDRVLDASLAPAVRKQLRQLLVEPVRAGPVRVLRTLLEPPLNAVKEGVVGLRTRLAGWAYVGAPLWVGYAAEMDYLDRVLGIGLDRSFLEAMEHCGLFWILNDICFAAERPSHLNRDEAGRLHCEVGPSVAYPSGWSWWHWHGTSVPQQVIEIPRAIAIDDIHHARGSERRRIMIERYRAGDKPHGIDAYLRDAGARRLDQDPDFGTLWHLDTAEAGPMLLMVEVTNRSPEPDGTYRHFLLRADPELRPIIGPGSFGQPQERTARNAVAASFGLSGAEYAPALET